MLKPEQIPDVVIVAACEEYGGGHLVDMKHAIAAAINAWPGVFSAIRTEEGGVEWDNEGNAPECLVLPLPQEASDD